MVFALSIAYYPINYLSKESYTNNLLILQIYVAQYYTLTSSLSSKYHVQVIGILGELCNLNILFGPPPSKSLPM